VWFLRYANGQTNKQTYSSSYFAPLPGRSRKLNGHVVELLKFVVVLCSSTADNWSSADRSSVYRHFAVRTDHWSVLNQWTRIMMPCSVAESVGQRTRLSMMSVHIIQLTSPHLISSSQHRPHFIRTVKRPSSPRLRPIRAHSVRLKCGRSRREIAGVVRWWCERSLRTLDSI